MFGPRQSRAEEAAAGKARHRSGRRGRSPLLQIAVVKEEVGCLPAITVLVVRCCTLPQDCDLTTPLTLRLGSKFQVRQPIADCISHPKINAKLRFELEARCKSRRSFCLIPWPFCRLTNEGTNGVRENIFPDPLRPPTLHRPWICLVIHLLKSKLGSLKGRIGGFFLFVWIAQFCPSQVMSM